MPFTVLRNRANVDDVDDPFEGPAYARDMGLQQLEPALTPDHPKWFATVYYDPAKFPVETCFERIARHYAAAMFSSNGGGGVRSSVRKWCTRLDSNQWPSPSEGSARKARQRIAGWTPRSESNLRRLDRRLIRSASLRHLSKSLKKWCARKKGNNQANSTV